MKYLLLFLMLTLACFPSNAKAQFKVLGETAMTWPGIHYQIFWLERIPPDRLVVGIRMVASLQAPAGGTLVGTPVPIPPHPSLYDIKMGNFRPLPFSLDSSIMVDDISKQQYTILPPIAPPGQGYPPSQVLTTITPGQVLIFSVQFKVPPPPPPPENGETPVKQTLSFIFPNAKDTIKSIPIPPPIPPVPSATP